jgi:hypothetical protein
MKGGIGHGSAFTETVAAVATPPPPPPPPPPKENSPQIGHQVVAEDEGSRTGLKTRSSLVGLLSSAGLLHDSAVPAAAAAATGSSGPPPSTPQRLKASSRSGDSILPSGHQVASPTSRQLTIFYGGQAHVYDDIPPEKVRAHTQSSYIVLLW